MDGAGKRMDRPVAFRKSKVVAAEELSLKSQRDKEAAEAERKARDKMNELRGLGGLVVPEQQQHSVYEPRITHTGERRAFNTGSTNLDYYKKKHLISPEQFNAGMRLYADFYQSGQITGLKSCLDVILGSSRGLPKAHLNFMVFERWRSAISDIHQRYRKITVVACCYGDWLHDIETTIPKYRRMDAFQRGLDDLLNHYEMQINPTRIMASFSASVITTQG